MPTINIKRPRCCECERLFFYSEKRPKKHHGITMYQGERFCLGGTKARRFKKSDAKIYVPVWCPKKVFPHVLRIYTIKSLLREIIFTSLLQENKNFVPSEMDYKLRVTGSTELDAKEYYTAGIYKNSIKPLSYEVVEIDDGIKPVFFFWNGNKLRYLPFFNKTKIG